MELVHKITFVSMVHNVRIFAKFVPMKRNEAAVTLSLFQIDCFWSFVERNQLEVNPYPTALPTNFWPIHKVWNY